MCNSHELWSEVGVETVARLPLTEPVALRRRGRVFETDLTLAEVTTTMSLMSVALVVAVLMAGERARGAGHGGRHVSKATLAMVRRVDTLRGRVLSSPLNAFDPLISRSSLVVRASGVFGVFKDIVMTALCKVSK